jgi:hypothetical protein
MHQDVRALVALHAWPVACPLGPNLPTGANGTRVQRQRGPRRQRCMFAAASASSQLATLPLLGPLLDALRHDICSSFRDHPPCEPSEPHRPAALHPLVVTQDVHALEQQQQWSKTFQHHSSHTAAAQQRTGPIAVRCGPQGERAPGPVFADPLLVSPTAHLFPPCGSAVLCHGAMHSQHSGSSMQYPCLPTLLHAGPSDGSSGRQLLVVRDCMSEVIAREGGSTGSGWQQRERVATQG